MNEKTTRRIEPGPALEREREAAKRLRARMARGWQGPSVEEEAAELLDRVERGDLEEDRLDLAAEIGGLGANEALFVNGEGLPLDLLFEDVPKLGVAAYRYAAVALTLALASKAIEEEKEGRGWLGALESLLVAMEAPEQLERLAGATEAGASWKDLQGWGRQQPAPELDLATRTSIALANTFGCFFPFRYGISESSAERMASSLGAVIAVVANQTPYSRYDLDVDQFTIRLDWYWALLEDAPRDLRLDALESAPTLNRGVAGILREALSAWVLGQPFNVARWAAARSAVP